MEFNAGVEKLYGSTKLTINNHLHIHLKQTIKDFSSPHGYWLFGFERFNGVLGRYNHNNRGIELTFMRTFTNKGNLRKNLMAAWDKFTADESPSTPFGQKFTADYIEYFDDFLAGPLARGVDDPSEKRFLTVDYAGDLLNHRATGVELIGYRIITSRQFKEVYMAPEHFALLNQFYRDAYKTTNELGLLDFSNSNILKFYTINLHGRVFNSNEARSNKGNWVQCLFIGKYDDRNNNERIEYWTGKILYFFAHFQNVLIDPIDNSIGGTTNRTELKEHWFAFVSFLRSVPRQQVKYEQCGLQEWQNNFNEDSVDCIIPLARFYSQVAVAEKPGNNKRMIIIPLQPNMQL